MILEDFIYCDALVLGTGLAGLNFALEFAQNAPDKKLIIVTKDPNPMSSTTHLAQGGIATVFSNSDSFDKHLDDTLRTGAGLTHESVARQCIESGPKAIQRLIECGVKFSKVQQDFDLTKEGGHSERRVFHADDWTGKAIMESLLSHVERNPNIEVITEAIAVDLITNKKIEKSSRKPVTCLGAYFLDQKSQKIFAIQSKITTLATGGASKVYKYTSNPDSNNGDGIAMAYRAGARIANMEFTQFHPTCLYHPHAKRTLLSEALRGEGAILLNKKGERFMEKYHPQKELAPRDIVSQSIDKEMKLHGDPCVFLQISHKGKEFIRQKFPHNYQTCLKFGFDLTKDKIPVVPAAHYTCGGVVVDENASTHIKALYAIGEVAHSGLHGANRLASNSLLEASVFSKIAADHALANFAKYNSEEKDFPAIPAWDPGFAKDGEEEVIISHNWEEIRTFMWNYVGIVRTNKRLEYAARRIELLKQEIRQNYWDRILSRNLVELRNIITIADLIVSSAKLRKESRGLHQNLDYPEQDDKLFKRDTIL